MTAPPRQFNWQQPAEPSPPPPLRRLRLGTPAEIAQQMRVIFRKVTAGQLSAMEGKRQSAILRDLADLHAATQTQRRLDAIEAALVQNRRSR